MRCFVSLGSAYLWFTALQCGRAFVRTARGLCTPVNCLLVSVLHLFYSLFEKVGGFIGVGFFSLMGVTLSISMAEGVLTDCVVGMCLVGEKKDDSDGDLCIHGFEPEIY